MRTEIAQLIPFHLLARAFSQPSLSILQPLVSHNKLIPAPKSSQTQRQTTFLTDDSCTAINQTVLDAKRFYAYGSPSTQTANVTAYEEAVVNVWPVITLFSHLSADGTRDSLNTAIQCVRASNGTTTAPSSPQSAAGRLPMPNVFAYTRFSMVALLAALYTSL